MMMEEIRLSDDDDSEDDSEDDEVVEVGRGGGGKRQAATRQPGKLAPIFMAGKPKVRELGQLQDSLAS